jgi:hypothetical protein
MVNMTLYDHAMQKPCKKNDSIYFCANFDLLVKNWLCWLLGQSFDFVDFFLTNAKV